MDDLRNAGTPGETQKPEAPRSSRGRSIAFQLAAVALTCVSALAGTGLARWLSAPEAEKEKAPAKGGTFPGRLFKDWKKPDLVVVVSGQQHGYLLPCGCSKPQVGGLERRYNLLQMIKAAGWAYTAVDLGDLPQRSGPAGLANEQGLIKYRYAMMALKEMGYTATTFGENDANLGLFNVLAEYSLNHQTPRVVTGNLMDTEKHFPEMTKPWEFAAPPGSNIKVGVTSIVGPTVAARIKELTRADNSLKFEKTPDALNRLLKEMSAKKVDLPILLYQGPTSKNGMKKPYTEAMGCAEAFPQFPIIVSLTDEDEPPSRPTTVKNKTGAESLIVSMGHKGKFIGVIGVYKTVKPDQPFTFAFERVELTDPEFLTAKENEKGHPIIELMEKYSRELHTQQYLVKHGRIRHSLQVMPKVPGLRRDVEVTYVGSEKCKSCHPDAFAIWKKTPHTHAYDTLVKAEKPSNRQYDPECIVCHTVGFGIVSGFVTDVMTPKLKDVGCESCHGPASAHVANKDDLTWQKRINPWRHLPKGKRQDAMDQMCQKCHDIDNDVTWKFGGFKRKWPKIAHPTEKPEAEHEKK